MPTHAAISPPGESLDLIDQELNVEHFQAMEASLRAAKPGDDQATRLRALLDAQHAAPRDQPAPVAPPSRPAPIRHTPPPAPALRSARIITVASGKGGVGKTNIAVNLSIALARRGVRVTLLDADLGTANADVICGVRPSARLDHVLAPGALGTVWQDAGKRTIADIAIAAPGGFRLIPGCSGVSRLADMSPIERRALLRVLDALDDSSDVIIVDAAAGIARAVTAFVHAADLTLVVTTPEPTALADAYALTKAAVLNDDQPDRDLLDTRLGVVVNLSHDPLEAFSAHARFSAVCEKFLGSPARLMGFVAQDLQVAQSVRAQSPLLVRSPQSPAALQIVELGDTVIDALGLRPQMTTTGSADAPQAPARRGLAALVRRLLRS